MSPQVFDDLPGVLLLLLLLLLSLLLFAWLLGCLVVGWFVWLLGCRFVCLFVCLFVVRLVPVPCKNDDRLGHTDALQINVTP